MMCLLVIAWQVHPRYRLVVAANRDEFHERPTEPMAKWPAAAMTSSPAGTCGRAERGWDRPAPEVRDRHELPRAAAPRSGRPFARRTSFPAIYVIQRRSPSTFIRPRARSRNSTPASICCLTDRGLASGTYPTARPSSRNHCRPAFMAFPTNCWILRGQNSNVCAGASMRWSIRLTASRKRRLFAILADPTQAGVDDALPDTGLSREWEQLLSSPFVSNRDYGTRCSTLVQDRRDGRRFPERTPLRTPRRLLGDTRFDLGPNEWP